MDSAHKEMQDSQKRHKENIFEQSTKLQVQQELKDNFKQQMEAFAAAWQVSLSLNICATFSLRMVAAITTDNVLPPTQDCFPLFLCRVTWECIRLQCMDGMF